MPPPLWHCSFFPGTREDGIRFEADPSLADQLFYLCGSIIHKSIHEHGDRRTFDLVRYFIGRGVKRFTCQDGDGRTSLMLAFHLGRGKVASWFLDIQDKGVDIGVDIADSAGVLPIQHTIDTNMIKTTAKLLSRGCDPNATGYNSRETPLSQAVRLRATQIVGLLTQHPAIRPSLEISGREGLRPLELIISIGSHPKIFEFLLESHMMHQVPIQMETCLSIASLYQRESSEFLVMLSSLQAPR